MRDSTLLWRIILHMNEMSLPCQQRLLPLPYFAVVFLEPSLLWEDPLLELMMTFKGCFKHVGERMLENERKGWNENGEIIKKGAALFFFLIIITRKMFRVSTLITCPLIFPSKHSIYRVIAWKWVPISNAVGSSQMYLDLIHFTFKTYH